MSVSGISSSNLVNYNTTNVQNQQQWQAQLQQLGQELQSGNLSALQTSAQTTAQTELTALQPGSQSGTTGVQADSSTQTFSPPQATPQHGIHSHAHHFRVAADSDGDSDSTTQDANPLGQIDTGNASTAQQAYSAWQQDLQQVGLNSDLLTAQSASWQPVSLSA
jgi:hypothetical protein